MSKIESAELALQAKLREWSSDSEEEDMDPPPMKAKQEAGASTKSSRTKSKKDPLYSKKQDGDGGSNVLYLGHLPREFGERELQRFLEQFGTLQRVRVSRSKKTGGSRGYAFVQFQSAEVAAIVADTLSSYLLMGKRRLVCHVLPADKVHPRLFFKREPPKKRLQPVRTLDRLKEVTERLLLREKQKREKLKELGIDYDFPGYAASATTAFSDPDHLPATTEDAYGKVSTKPSSAARRRRESDASLEAAGLPLDILEEKESERSGSLKKHKKSKRKDSEGNLLDFEGGSASKKHKATTGRKESNASQPREAEEEDVDGAALTPIVAESSCPEKASGRDSVSSKEVESSTDKKQKRARKAEHQSSGDAVSPPPRKDSATSFDDVGRFSSETKKKHSKKDKKRKDSVSSEGGDATELQSSCKALDEAVSPPPRKDSTSSYDDIGQLSSEKKKKHSKKEKKQRKDFVNPEKRDKEEWETHSKSSTLDGSAAAPVVEEGAEVASKDAGLTSPVSHPTSESRRVKSDKKRQKKKDKKKRRESAP